MPYEWGSGRYCVVDIMKMPHKKPYWKGAAIGGERPDTDIDIWVFVVGKR
jgi:hypothetical protein